MPDEDIGPIGCSGEGGGSGRERRVRSGRFECRHLAFVYVVRSLLGPIGPLQSYGIVG